MSDKLKIGLLGAGHLGKIHLKCILATECWTLAGFYDPDEKNAATAIAQYGVPRFDTVEALLAEVDAVDIVTPTPEHFVLAAQAMRAGKHVFVEKPVTQTVEEGRSLLQLAEQQAVQVQVGHVERFNPAYLALKNMLLTPMFIESHRLAAFQPRGTEVSVILDLMIHDLDLVLVQGAHEALATGQRPLCVGVEVRPELGEGLEVAELGELDLDAARDLLHRADLRVADHEPLTLAAAHGPVAGL